MAKQTDLFLHSNHFSSGVSFVNADGTTLKIVCSGGLNDSDLKCLMATSTDTSALNVKITLSNTSVDQIIGTVNVSANAGTDGTVNAVDLMNSTVMPFTAIDSSGKRYLPLKSGWFIKAAPITSVTAAKTLYVTAIGHDY